MKLNLYLLYIIFPFIYISCLEFLNNINEKLIISIASKFENLNNTSMVIESILNQNCHHSYYKIILIISKKEIKNINILPKSILLLEKNNKIRLILIDTDINLQTRLLIAIKEYPKNPILIINDDTTFPEGWLEMFINDHKKYPNDIISGSIQYFIGKDLEIKKFSEGYRGRNFGIFNHIANMVFNFAFVNTNLGGTLYPVNSFKNNDFFDYQLFNKTSRNSDEFWQSCFIMIENKILRQSSKIYDYTQYILLKDQQVINKEVNYKSNLVEFCKFFPNFRNIVQMRQNKILISLTSYKKRFIFLPTVIESLRNQSITPNKIVLVLSKNDTEKSKLKINGIDIITVNKDLKPHKKYYYTMLKYPEYAIVTVDDDVIYCKNMLKSLYNNYIDYPNIVLGRRGHLMRYKENGELNNYNSWIFEYKIITEANYDIFLTGVGGVLYPPDILNINRNYSNLIRETLLGDDITLKNLEVNKGIEVKWVSNRHLKGLKEMTNYIDKPLFKINNIINNDIYIKNINIDIKNLILENLCVNYKNISTGLTTYLFNINNIIKKNDWTIFNIDAYSFCPIDNRIKFIIDFDNNITNRANCYFNSNHSLVKDNLRIFKTQKILRATCILNRKIVNFNSYYFPKAFSENISNIKIFNYFKYFPFIFKQFFYVKRINKYILQSFFYKSLDKEYSIAIRMNDTNFICILHKNVIYPKNEQPILENFICNKLINFNNIPTLDINELNINLIKFNCFDDAIPNQFIIYKIYKEYINEANFIIIKGRFFDDLKFNINNLNINLIYPKKSVKCFVKSTNKYIQAYIYCNIGKANFEEILINNQIIYSNNCNESLLLINKEIYYQNYQIIDNDIFKQKNFSLIKSFKKIDYIIYFTLLISFYIKSKLNKNVIN